MVVVKVRETYDLCTVKNKMTVISIHTPKPDIIKRNFPGLLMQCKAYRPLSASVRIACASVQPLDPLGVGTTENDVAPEDVFNPILYKAMTNFGMSQLEARICQLAAASGTGLDIDGQTTAIDVDSNTSFDDEFNIYYSLLSNAHGWRHAAPQAGLSMDNLRPLVYELLWSVGDQEGAGSGSTPPGSFKVPGQDGNASNALVQSIRGNAKPLPMINCTSYSYTAGQQATYAEAGFKDTGLANGEVNVPWINVCVAGIIIPPSRLHQLFYRMVIEWDIEFSSIRPVTEIMSYNSLNIMGGKSHYQNYSYGATKQALTGTEDSILDSDTCMVSANVDVKKVM